MQDQNVYGVIVQQVDPSGHPGLHDLRQGARCPVAFRAHGAGDLRPQDLQMEERTIRSMGEPIGRLRIYLTTRFLEEELRQRMVYGMGLTLAFDLAVDRRPLSRPLEGGPEAPADHRTLRHGRECGRGGARRGPRPGAFHGELESLRVSIGEMVSLLQSRLKALQEKETTLTAVLDSVPQDVYWKDAGGRYLGCNKVFARTAGLASPEAIVGRHELEFPGFHGDERTIQQLARPGGDPYRHRQDPCHGDPTRRRGRPDALARPHQGARSWTRRGSPMPCSGCSRTSRSGSRPRRSAPACRSS